ncbi:MAG: F0F1 ATP synthase subunit A [Prevotella sp.]|nr:F0F1 ATP synthase subunit A [Bacteroides sp.]MCM1365938.1 F0F1 ATP synthase subunit A [Prevotella sp.]MCM1436641.1 F0F1 ATP synthase subunit A [Prevotella sp.]
MSNLTYKFAISLALILFCFNVAVANPKTLSDEISDDSKVAKEKIQEDKEKSEEGFNVKEVIFHHLGDGYGWEVPFSHVYRIPLPVIVRAQDGQWFCFSSGKLTEVEIIKDEETGKEKKELLPVIHKVERNGKIYQFVIAHVSSHANKIVEIFPLSAQEEAQVKADAAKIAADGKTENAEHGVVVDGYVYHDGQYYKEYKPFDISITKNVLALLIAAALVTWMVMSLVRYQQRHKSKAPRKGLGFFEMLVQFIYEGSIKPTLGAKAPKFAPYLLTCFFFILTMNLLGLVVIFPGGANLTGNIAITLVLAALTFIVTNVYSKKHYWKEIFWPDVPLFLKFPLPIMQFIEIFGVFTKPAALCVRLFANMMGGHIIVITLISLIFIFAAFGAAALGGSLVISVLFTVFMLLLDVLVSFIQAYVFTLLSTIFISMSQEEGHEEGHAEHHKDQLELNESAMN